MKVNYNGCLWMSFHDMEAELYVLIQVSFIGLKLAIWNYHYIYYLSDEPLQTTISDNSTVSIESRDSLRKLLSIFSWSAIGRIEMSIKMFSVNSGRVAIQWPDYKLLNLKRDPLSHFQCHK